MLGAPEDPGVLPCAVKQIFQTVAMETEYEYSIWVSYLEIYNE
jgi:hypothetical protein